MKIAQIIPDFGVGGAETMCENLIYELREQGHEVIVVSLYSVHSPITERIEKNGQKIVYLGKKRGFDFSMFSKLKKLFLQEKPDVVHTHRNAAQYAIPVAKKVKAKVHTVHNVAKKENSWVSRKINKSLFKKGLIPVALSDSIQESIIDEYKLKRDRVPIVFNGVNLSNCIRKTDYTVSGDFNILHIGRFAPQKNHIGLIEAFNVFQLERTNATLSLIGDGELRCEIEQKVSEYNLTDKVKFLGIQENVYKYLNQADIFILPSNYEGVPMTLIEAMGTGLPIVATAVGGVPDMLENGKSAWVIPNAQNEIVEAINEAYDNAGKREEFGKNALLEAERFSSKGMARKYLEIYNKN